jgi:hypothetical protein
MISAVGAVAARGQEFSFDLAPSRRRVRPLCLVAALGFATLNVYSLYWMVATWREISVTGKRSAHVLGRAPRSAGGVTGSTRPGRA